MSDIPSIERDRPVPATKAVTELLEEYPEGLTFNAIDALLKHSAIEITSGIETLEKSGEIFQVRAGTYVLTTVREIRAPAALQPLTYQLEGNESELLKIPDRVKELRLQWYKASEDAKTFAGLIDAKESEVQVSVVTEQGEDGKPKYSNDTSRKAETRLRLLKDSKYNVWEEALKSYKRKAYEVEAEVERLKARHYGLQKLVEIKRSKEWEEHYKARTA